MYRIGPSSPRTVISGLILATAVALVSGTGLAQTGAPATSPGPLQNPAGPRLEQALLPDGSTDLTSGRRTIMSPAGWRMSRDATGAPRFTRDEESVPPFVPDRARALRMPREWEGAPQRLGESPGASATVPDPADVNWDDRFVLPNGVDQFASWGGVAALTVDGAGNLYVGGSFHVAGDVSAYGVAKWDGTKWSGLESTRDFGYSVQVRALAVDGAGNLYAGGLVKLTAWGEYAHAEEVVLKWDGTSWSTLGSVRYGRARAPSKEVKALAVDGAGNLYVAGVFDTIGGVIANYVATWNGTSWSALGSGTSGSVSALALDHAGNLYAGGGFHTAGGVSVNHVAKWDGSIWSAVGSGTANSVMALAIDPAGNLYAGETFTTGPPASRTFVSKWDGTSWSRLGSGMAGSGSWYVRALAADGAGNVYAGGDFTIAGEASASHVAKWDGTSWTAVGSGTDFYVTALEMDGAGNLYAGGHEFGVAGGKAANSLARWDGSEWWAVGSGTGLGVPCEVRCLVPDAAGHLYAGGHFAAAGGVAAYHVARLDGAGWSALGSGTLIPSNWEYRGWVHSLAVDGKGNLYAGGEFSLAGGVSANNIAKWDGTSWSALGSGVGTPYLSYNIGAVYALAVDGEGNLYAGGGFTTAGGVSTSNVARWDGTSWSALGSGVSLIVSSLAFDSAGNLYAGGEDYASDQPVGHVVKWDGVSWSELGSGMRGMMEIYSYVSAIAVDSEGNVYAGGDFSTASGVSANSVAKWDGTSWSALGSGMGDAIVEALALDRAGNLYAGGTFLTAGGEPARKVARWDGTSWSALGSGIATGADCVLSVYALAADDAGNLYAGGDFTTAGGKVSSHIALWRERHTITATAGPGGAIAPSGAVTVINGDDQTFSITPNTGYHVADVLVDGALVGAATSYTFPRITADHTIAATFSLGVVFVLEPRELNLKSQGQWVTGTIRLPAPYRASEIDVASIRLNGVVSVAPEAPCQIEEHDTRLTAKFSRAEVQRTLTPGEQVPVNVSGMVAGTPFMDTDHIAVKVRGMDRTAADERLADGHAPEFSLRPLNPALGPLVVSFSLASDAPAALAVFDVSGRLVVRRDLGSFGPGAHTLRLGDLPTGAYVLRLTQADRSLTSRAVVIR
jgi:hypothetical protein